MRELEVLHERHFVFRDGKISIQYYEMPSRKLSLRDLSELFTGANDFFPNMHSRVPSSNDFELFFYEPGGYEELTVSQYYSLLHSAEMNNKLFGSPLASNPLKATVRSARNDIQMGLCLDVIERKRDEVVLEWFVSTETEASASMLHFLISNAYQEGIIYPVTIDRMEES